jgi:cytochrome P450
MQQQQQRRRHVVTTTNVNYDDDSNGSSSSSSDNINLSASPAHLDETVYEEPLKFDGLRFVKMKDCQDQDIKSEAADSDSSKKFDIVTVGVNFLSFGYGQHACPGRFFVVNEMMLMLAHIVLTYELKLEIAGVHPPDVWIVTSRLPNIKANVLFRKLTSM